MNFAFREHWRIWMLVLFVLVSTVAIFAPLGGSGGITGESGADQQATSSQYTNLEYGLDLAGGTRIRAPFVGMTADDVEFDPEEERAIERDVQEELGLGSGDVRVTYDRESESGTVEVFQDRFVGNVTRAEFAAALEAAGVSAETDDIRMGVTADTRDGVEDVLNDRLTGEGLGGGSATQSASPGQQFMIVEVPGATRNEVIDLIGERGQVEVVALFPDENGTYRNVSLLTQEDFREIGSAQQSERGSGAYVPLVVNDDAAPGFQDAMQEHGFAQEGGTRCNYDENETLEENKQELEGDRCLMTVLDGEVVFAARITSGLAADWRAGTWVENPRYQSSTHSIEDARELEINMRHGALRTELDIENRGTSYFLQPSLAQKFKPLSLATGAAAVGAVALVVFLRYRKREVAAPMLLTAAAEVYLLLGFAAMMGLPLDLSHIAGFIAVIGTGVDDLVIIADEIMQRGEVRTSRVFESRFKKAFWVIGAAAATTIVAMSPLAILSLGDLFGFAIITIVGVLIGVLVTRPAYWDILRILVLGDEN